MRSKLPADDVLSRVTWNSSALPGDLTSVFTHNVQKMFKKTHTALYH